MKFNLKIFSNEAIQVGLIVLAAAVTRLAFPGWTEFKADEARLLALAFDMVDGGGFALRGISSSVGVPNFPASVWLYALPVAIWPHVYAATLFTGLLNVAAVALTYFLVRRFWGRTPALAAALMFAVAPWAIIHSRKIWAQNLIPFFAVVWATSGLLAFVKRRPWWLVLHLIAAVFAFQIHLAAVSLAAASLVLVLFFWRRVLWRELVVGIAGASLISVPFGIFVSQQAGLLDRIGALGGGETGWRFSWSPFTHGFRLFTGWQIHSLTGPNGFEQYLAQAGRGWPVIVFWLLLLAAGCWALFGSRLSGNASKEIKDLRKFMGIWLVIPIVSFVWFPIGVELHYLLPIFPLPFVLAGIGFDCLFRRFRGWGWAGLGVSAGWQLFLFGSLLLFVVTNPTPGGFGTPLRFQLAAVDYAEALVTAGQIDEIIVAGPGEDPQIDEVAAVYDVHLRSVPHRFVDITRSAVFPASASGVLLAPGRFSLEADYAEAATSVRRFPLRPDEGLLTVYTLPGEVRPLMANPFDPEPLLANFVALLGHDPLTPQGDWRLLWRVGTPGEVDYHFFNHLIDPFEERVAQADAAVFGATQWREGDVVLSRFTLQVPVSAQRPFTMRTGMYRYPSLENVPVLDEAANPAADAVEIFLGP